MWCAVGMSKKLECAVIKKREALFLVNDVQTLQRNRKIKSSAERRWGALKEKKITWRTLRAVNWKVKKEKRFLFCAACIVLYLRSSIRFSWKNFEMISERVDVLTSCRPRWVEIENVNIRSVNKKRNMYEQYVKKISFGNMLVEHCFREKPRT